MVRIPGRFLAVIAVVTTGALTACGSGGSGNGGPGSASKPTASSPTAGAPVTHSTAAVSDETLVTPDGRTRSYRVVVPASVRADRAAPLVLALHGGIGSGPQFESTSGFDDLAAAHGFVVVYPDGIEIGGRGILASGHVWNGGRCCSTAARENVDDVGFLRAVIDRVEADRAIDVRRVYAVGHSNGAIMSYRLACELSDRIAAIGIQAGAIEIDRCAPAHPVSVLAIHGTADTNIPIDGGKGTGISGATFSSPTDAAATFARLDGCGASETRTDPDNNDVHVETWSGCGHGTEVEFVRVTGATHAWMGHRSARAATGLTGAPYLGFDSSAAIWDFLAAHPRAV
jgi:polyhydroxybutyrate depolymerase